MIKTNELRIGNLLLWHVDGSYELTATVTEIFEDTFSVHLHGSLQANGTGIKYDFKPMPITPEWLKKLGGTQLYEDQPEFWQIGLFVFNLHNQYGLCQWDQEGQCIIFGTIHYKYVHQLQNLYFALTGEELIIKE